MTKHFVKCLVGVTLVHVVAAAVVLVAYSFAKTGNTPEDIGREPAPAASRDYRIMHVNGRDDGGGEPGKTVQPQTHVVRRGESYWTIARKYDVSTEALIGANDRSESDVLRVGESLVIPADN